MNILLLGAGGREHALAWKMVQSEHCSQLYIAPGNAGTSALGINLDINVSDFAAIKQACAAYNINLLLVGPEEPLVNGIYDFCTNDPLLKDVIVIGPSADAAQLEGSKHFSKQFMQRHSIPTAAYATFTRQQLAEANIYIDHHSLPVVLKANGLAAGKGVVIADTHHAAHEVMEQMIVGRQFGEASDTVVIEEFMQGIELSVFVLTDGIDYKIIGHAKDYKRAGEGDTGLNTGGMGCVSPVPFADEIFLQKIEDRIIKPTIKGIREEDLDYHGFLFFGIMNTNGEPWVVEYNCRMGDPETEVVMPRLQNDLVALFVALHNGKLSEQTILFYDKCVATTMAVSGGYPGAYGKGMPIKGLNGRHIDEVMIFHAGTMQLHDEVVTNGGRVLAVSAFGNTIADAAAKSRAVLNTIYFTGIHYRKDIGYEFE